MNFPEYASDIKLAEVESESVRDLRDLFNRRETVDAWQHERMLRFLSPLIATHPDANWLTIGDAGADAWILRKYVGAKHCTASSISDARLKKIKDLGYLDGINVLALNAEHLDLPDSSFDFLLCTQAYHHFRRPALAFYEFMRVARVGFVMIEPAESAARPLDAIRTLAKILLRKRPPIYDLFEPVGNYIYRLSERDIFRMLAAVQLPWFGIATFNSFNHPRLATQRRDSPLARLILHIGVGVQDILSLCHAMSPGLFVVFVPTSPAADSAQDALRAAHFRIVTIPKNPYTTEDCLRSFI